MRTRLAALLALPLAGTAFAQSSLTIYGGVDLALSHYRADGGGSRTQLTPGGNQNNRLGFRGREDLGGGLYAAFELEMGLAPDTGLGLTANPNNQPSGATVVPAGMTFNRRSILQVGGNWGELRVGRDYVPSFWPLYLYDPFRTGVGFGGITILGSTVTNLRASNTVAYITPGCDGIVCKGWFAHAMYGFGENASGQPGSQDGNVTGARVGYGGERWDVSVARSRTTNNVVGWFTQTSGGGTYDFGFARLMLLAGENKTSQPVAALANGTRAPFWQVGAFVPLGPGYIPVAYTRVSRNDPADSSAFKVAIGYVYFLSKRTALYTTYAHVENRNALAIPVNVGADAGPSPLPGRSASGLDLGIRLTF